VPSAVTLRGRYVTVEPLDGPRHGAALWTAVEGRNDLWTWLANGPFASQSELIDFIEQWRQAEPAVLLAIVPADSGQAQATPFLMGGRASGWASFMRANPAHGVIEVGNILFSPALQRTRAATEAMYLMAGHVFEHLGYRRYEWKCNAENQPSRRAALRLGFTFEGVFRQHMVIKGRNRDTAWFSMLDKEWPARKRAFEAWLNPANFTPDGQQRTSLARSLP
jgi:RimJ/RimL family protein N-acetyltransferase